MKPKDATERNIKASNKRDAELKARIKQLEARVKILERRVDKLAAQK